MRDHWHVGKIKNTAMRRIATIFFAVMCALVLFLIVVPAIVWDNLVFLWRQSSIISDVKYRVRKEVREVYAGVKHNWKNQQEEK